MTIQGVDLSNHNGLPIQYRAQPWYQSAEFVIAQAIPRPSPPGLTGPQLQAAIDDGKHTGIYTWLWHDPTWRMGDQTVEDDQRLRLETVPDDLSISMRPWLDVEDNQSTHWQVPITQRVDDVNRAFAVLDEWAAGRGLPRAGRYWSDYFINLLFGGVDYWPDRVQWKAHYSAPAGSLIGGTVVAHQYTSTPVDMNVMLESEIVGQEDHPDVTDAEREQMQQKIDGLVGALGYVAGDVLKPLTRPTAAKYVKAAVAQIRAVAEQQGVAHA